MYQHFPFQGPPKFTHIGIFGLKMYHLATLPGGVSIENNRHASNITVVWLLNDQAATPQKQMTLSGHGDMVYIVVAPPSS
jgi:hypothetical protein